LLTGGRPESHENAYLIIAKIYDMPPAAIEPPAEDASPLFIELAAEPVDSRKGIDGLAGICKRVLQSDAVQRVELGSGQRQPS
jgi:hypothetical protein